MVGVLTHVWVVDAARWHAAVTALVSCRVEAHNLRALCAPSIFAPIISVQRDSANRAALGQSGRETRDVHADPALQKAVAPRFGLIEGDVPEQEAHSAVLAARGPAFDQPAKAIAVVWERDPPRR